MNGSELISFLFSRQQLGFAIAKLKIHLFIDAQMTHRPDLGD
jgi:hypothetical protein